MKKLMNPTNHGGTVEKLQPIKWYWQLVLFFKDRFYPMTVAEIKEFIKKHV